MLSDINFDAIFGLDLKFLEHFKGHVFYYVKHYVEIEDVLHMIVKVKK
jgi:hypothetical protein